jgi:hypothetical protein
MMIGSAIHTQHRGSDAFIIRWDVKISLRAEYFWMA